jgi:hypothetical protein
MGIDMVYLHDSLFPIYVPNNDVCGQHIFDFAIQVAMMPLLAFRLVFKPAVIFKIALLRPVRLQGIIKGKKVGQNINRLSRQLYDLLFSLFKNIHLPRPIIVFYLRHCRMLPSSFWKIALSFFIIPIMGIKSSDVFKVTHAAG